MFKFPDIKIVCDPAIPEDSMVFAAVAPRTATQAWQQQLHYRTMEVADLTSAQRAINQGLNLKIDAILHNFLVPRNPQRLPECCVYHRLTGFNDRKCAGLAPNPYPMPKDYVKS